MEVNFCRRCAAPLTSTAENSYKCSNGHSIYANMVPTVGVFFLTEDNQVMLSVRGIEPHKGMLDAFGGFLDGEETYQAAAARELAEELSLHPGEYEPLQYLTSGVGHYTYESEDIPILSTLFWSRLKTTKHLQPSDDVAEVRTIPLHDVDPALLHDDDIRVGIEALQRLVASGGATEVKSPA